MRLTGSADTSTKYCEESEEGFEIDRDFWRAVSDSISDISYSSLRLLLAYTLSHVVPGAEVLTVSRELSLVDPRSGEEVLYIGDGASISVNRKYRISRETVDELVRGIASALYTLTLVHYNRLKQKLASTPQGDPSWQSTHRLFNEVVELTRELHSRLQPYVPVPSPELAEKLEEFTANEEVLHDAVMVVYSVKTPRHPAIYEAFDSESSSITLRTDTGQARLEASGDPRGVSLRARFISRDRVGGRSRVVFRSAVDAFHRSRECEGNECVHVVVAEIAWFPVSIHYDELVVPSNPAVVEKHVALVKEWWRTLTRVDAGSSSTSGQRETAALRFWRSLAEHGEWTVVHVKPIL
ncbi:MAG: hypothetical protein QXQ90_07845 [Desulfurococcaceae archaeon]